MGRRIVACLALAALVVSLSACTCQRAGVAPAAGAKAGTVCLTPCIRYHDCTACYASEADRDMARTRDCLPPGGSCAGCEHVTVPCEDRHRDGCACSH
jgi:hypothetical protein